MRTARVHSSTVAYHLISRFVERKWFIDSDEDRAVYLQLLGHALPESDWRCLAYALMSSHVHLLVVAGEQPLASWLRRVHSPFAKYVNAKADRIGSVFVRGPKDFEVRPENEGHVIAYVHNNPVEAKVVARARDSDWTSHRAYLGHERPPRWLHVEEGLARAGFSSSADFEQWVDRTPGDPNIIELGIARRAAHRRGAVELGTPRTNPTEIPLVARPWAHIRVDPGALVAATAELLRLSKTELCSRRKSPQVVSARRIAIHAANNFGLSGSDIAAALGFTQQAASKQLRIELTDREIAFRDAVVGRMSPPTVPSGPSRAA